MFFLTHLWCNGAHWIKDYKEVALNMRAEMQSYLIVFIVSLLSSGAIYWLMRQRNQNVWGSSNGPQKIHQGVVPRIGGIAIILGVCGSLVLSQKYLLAWLMIAAAPVFIVGLAEDFTGSVSAKLRLVVSLVTGYLFCWLTGYQITNVSIDAVGFLLAIPVVSFVLTSLAVAAMVNALNMVDGLNGLARTTAIMIITSVGILSGQGGDFELQFICFSIVSACLGFLVWNFPFGKIFLGDGGAYFLGALVAGIAILLPERNNEISPFSSMLIIIYPFYELVRSTVRRIYVKGYNLLEPDDRHIHSLIYGFVSSRVLMTRPNQNSLASVMVLILPLSCCFWALMFFNERLMLFTGIFAFIVFYEALIALISNRKKV